MSDYSNGKIYQICSLLTNKIYIGSTINSLNKRFRGHKKKYKAFLNNGLKYQTSFDMLEYGDCFIELIEDCPCNSKQELCRREGELQLQFINVIVNRYIAGRTEQEWLKEHTEEKRIYNKAHYEANKAHYETNKDRINKLRRERYQRMKLVNAINPT